VGQSLREEVDEGRKRNLMDIIAYARWEAEMVRKLGVKWFEARDRWLIEAFEGVKEMWGDPKIREAELKAILAKDKVKHMRLKKIEKEQQ